MSCSDFQQYQQVYEVLEETSTQDLEDMAVIGSTKFEKLAGVRGADLAATLMMMIQDVLENRGDTTEEA
jgi:hypothetical protein